MSNVIVATPKVLTPYLGVAVMFNEMISYGVEYGTSVFSSYLNDLYQENGVHITATPFSCNTASISHSYSDWEFYQYVNINSGLPYTTVCGTTGTLVFSSYNDTENLSSIVISFDDLSNVTGPQINTDSGPISLPFNIGTGSESLYFIRTRYTGIDDNTSSLYVSSWYESDYAFSSQMAYQCRNELQPLNLSLVPEITSLDFPYPADPLSSTYDNLRDNINMSVTNSSKVIKENNLKLSHLPYLTINTDASKNTKILPSVSSSLYHPYSILKSRLQSTSLKISSALTFMNPSYALTKNKRPILKISSLFSQLKYSIKTRLVPNSHQDTITSSINPLNKIVLHSNYLNILGKKYGSYSINQLVVGKSAFWYYKPINSGRQYLDTNAGAATGKRYPIEITTVTIPFHSTSNNIRILYKILPFLDMSLFKQEHSAFRPPQNQNHPLKFMSLNLTDIVWRPNFSRVIIENSTKVRKSNTTSGNSGLTGLNMPTITPHKFFFPSNALSTSVKKSNTTSSYSGLTASNMYFIAEQKYFFPNNGHPVQKTNTTSTYSGLTASTLPISKINNGLIVINFSNLIHTKLRYNTFKTAKVVYNFVGRLNSIYWYTFIKTTGRT